MGKERKMSEGEQRSEELFINFIIMMSQSVMLQLGKIANPMSGKVEKNLEGARAAIDLLVMLKEKTKGNLSDREEKFFATTLSTLQMNYVDETKKEEKEPAGKGEGTPSASSGQDPSASSGQDPSAGTG
ncbi:MAG: DUF1844 domain-containing protein [Candidatus Ratteibacteria bacterium]|nr:DUF1844 domain-containing protein [Candidatus Ratteibacteria bacterium]